MADKIRPEWKPFGDKLRRLRRQAGLSQAGLGVRVKLTGGMIGHLERATRIPNRDHVRELDMVFATGGELDAMWVEAVQGNSLLPWFRDFLLMERRADSIFEYHPILIPGLLQTRDYARVLVTARQSRKAPEEIEEIVEVRAERLPAILPNRPTLWVVVEQSVIDRIVGDERVMRDQFDHIVQLADSGVVRFQVVPSDVRYHCGLCAPFRLMSIGGRKVVRMEHTLGETTFDRAPEVEQMSELFGALQAEALSPRRSLELLHATMKGLR